MFLIAATATAQVAVAGLTSEFSGFNAVFESQVSGLKSSYYSDTQKGNLLPNYMFSLGPSRVHYPFGVGEVPSPGTRNIGTARNFDEGAMGVKVDGQNLIVQVASTLNPYTGFFDPAWGTWYGQGDVFLTTQDAAGAVRQFALLNTWAHYIEVAAPVAATMTGDPVTLDHGYYDTAEQFHVSGGAGHTSLEGHLVGLGLNSDIAVAGGDGSYSPSYTPPPEGLDYRIYAQGGTDLGGAGLTINTTTDIAYGGRAMSWYIETWTIPIAKLSSGPVFTVGLHMAPSCGNDQIGLVADVHSEPPPPIVPAPAAVVLGAVGLGFLKLGKRSFSKGTHGLMEE